MQGTHLGSKCDNGHTVLYNIMTDVTNGDKIVDQMLNQCVTTSQVRPKKTPRFRKETNFRFCKNASIFWVFFYIRLRLCEDDFFRLMRTILIMPLWLIWISSEAMELWLGVQASSPMSHPVRRLALSWKIFSGSRMSQLPTSYSVIQSSQLSLISGIFTDLLITTSVIALQLVSKFLKNKVRSFLKTECEVA